jgi:hypothetical protein
MAARALALVLMREALDLLDRTDDVGAAAHLQHSIDTLLKRRAAADMQPPAQTE